jgi:hypothetical protein
MVIMRVVLSNGPFGRRGTSRPPVGSICDLAMTTNLQPTIRAIDALADPRAWVDGATHLLDRLGFVLINAEHPEAPAGCHLLVGLRETPTLEHFDPESVAFYARSHGGKVEVATLHRATVAEFGTTPRTVLWGHVHVVDRLGVENRFLTFGGQLRSADVDPALTVLDLTSPAPVVRWGGHSQGTDWLAAAIGAFFGRLIVAVDFRRGAEARLAATPPLVLYAAFLAQEVPRREEIVRRHGLRRRTAQWVSAEAARLRGADGATWAAGLALLAELDLEAFGRPTG